MSRHGWQQSTITADMDYFVRNSLKGWVRTHSDRFEAVIDTGLHGELRLTHKDFATPDEAKRWVELFVELES